MEVEVTTLTRRGAAVMRRSQRASAPRIGLGRGTDNEVPLPDIRVGLHVAALVPRDAGIAIEKLGTSPLYVNGKVVESAALSPGDEIMLGPYRITVLDAPEGCDGAIQIELAQPLGAALARLSAGARIGLERTNASKRAYAWAGFILIAVVCLVVPIIVFGSGMMRPWQKAETTTATVPKLIGLSWNTGDFSNAHRFFAADCKTCHEGAFSRVADSACLSCHTKVGNHVEHGIDLGVPGEKVASLRCIACHTEHRGLDGSVIRTETLCLDCHRNLQQTAPAAKVENVSGFAHDDAHPQFRATLVGASAPVVLDPAKPPVNQPGLKFEHKTHMDTINLPTLGPDRQVKGCGDCHVAEPSGQGFAPITYKQQCQRCHELTFANVGLPYPEARVPHGDDTGVIAAVWNYYAGLALRASAASSAPASAPDTTASVTAQSRIAINTIFDKYRGCAYCHYSNAEGGEWDSDKILAAALPPQANPPRIVAPVTLLARFLPNAQFDHASHRGMDCASCHSVRAPVGIGKEAVMIPGKENCTQCHGAEDAAHRTQSTCITCHIFHRDAFGPFRKTAGVVQ